MKKHNNKILIAGILLTIFASCKVTKDIDIPRDAFPKQYRIANISTDSTSIADLDWELFFAEEDIIKLIDSAIARNNELQIAEKNIEIAQLRFAQTKWNNIPQADLVISGSTSNPSDNSFVGMNLNQALGQKHIEDFSTAVALSWEADIWKKINNQKREAFANFQQSDEIKKVIQTHIVANVSKAYYNLLMLDAQLKIAKRNLQLNDSTARIIKLKYDAGQVSSLAIQQAQAQKLVAEQLVPLLQQNIAIQENALSTLTGEFPKDHLRTIELNEVILKKVTRIGVPSSLLNRRPDVKKAELALLATNAKVGITKAEMYPSLRITAQAGLNSFETSSWFNLPASLFGTVAGGITQPLLNNKKLKTQYEISLVEREKAVINFRQVVLLAVGEVSDALIKVEKLEKQELILKNRVTTSQAAIHNANLLFTNGMAEYLEVLSAQSNLLQSELELANLKKEQLSAHIDLYRSLGGGWK